MRKTLGMISIAALVSVPGVLGLTSAAGAATPGHVAFAVGHFSHVNTVPNSNIKGAGKYKPKTLNVTWSASAPPASDKCKEKKISFSITNTTSVSQTVTYEGAAFATIPAGEVEGICAWGTGDASAQFGLQSSSSTLTVNIS